MRSRTKNHVHEVPSAPASPPCERGSVALIRWTAMALPKLVCERIARSFASRTGADIYALRIGVVIEPADYGRFPAALADPLSRKRDAWSYIDVRDLARIVDFCLEKDGLGFQVFNATNDEIIANEPTTSSLTKHAPRTPMPANSRGSRLRCPIERRGSFWASASCTTGEKCGPGRDRSSAETRRRSLRGSVWNVRVENRRSLSLRPSQRLRSARRRYSAEPEGISGSPVESSK